jgi:centromere protein O
MLYLLLSSAEVFLDGEEWNDGLLATLRERVHMEADRKADNGNAGFSLVCHPEERITYRVGNKVICCLDGSRIGIQFETSTAGILNYNWHFVTISKCFFFTKNY